MERVLIVGGGLAAATAVGELRERGYDGRLEVVAGEAHNPYERPPLSKGYLLGKDDVDAIYPKPADWYAEHDVALTTGVRAIALGDHTLTLVNGAELGFDRLLLATGAVPRRLALPGSQAEGIHTFRTVEDAETLRAQLADGGKRVVFVGGGWIGLELAAAAREYGNEVTIVAPEAVPLASALGNELGTMFRQLHEEHGVEFWMGTSVTGFVTDGTRVTGVQTDAGTVDADLVVVAIGVQPDTELAESAGIAVDYGILTDEHLATSAPDVFAAGDVANAFHPVLGQRLRSEHWANAIAGGKVAARAILGEDAVLDDIPYFFTDQYDLGMEYSGYGPLAKEARVVYRGDRDGREFIAFWVVGAGGAEGRVVAGMNVNVWDVNEQVQALIRSGRPVDLGLLADASIELGALA